MWIKNLEEQLEFDREVIYATALLHDIGKDEQYESGISHDVASERVADAILGGMPDDVAFEPADAAAIKTAILGHRKLRVNSQPLSVCSMRPIKRRAPALHAPRAMLATGAMIKEPVDSRVVSLRGRGSKRRRRSR
ncbi:MAG: HD domain-containing protein [Collinsella sp.]